MKKFRLIFLLLCYLIFTHKIFAHDIAVKNSDGKIIYYSFNYGGPVPSLIVTYCGDNSEETSQKDYYYGILNIPEEVFYMGKDYKVTNIDGYAFNGCVGLESVTLPNGLEYIGDYSFSGCTGLTSLVVPNSVIGINPFAFSLCM